MPQRAGKAFDDGGRIFRDPAGLALEPEAFPGLYPSSAVGAGLKSGRSTGG